ncbi:MAG: hypothetical protein JXR19_03220 [Bacteroidia bacterium]
MRFKYFLVLIAAALVFNSGCKEEEPEPDPTTNVKINFTHKVNDMDLSWDTLIYRNSLGDTFGVSTLKYFVSGVMLHNTNGDSVLLADLNYVDGRMVADYSIEKTIPQGNYNKLSFFFGIDSARNVDGMYSNPPESLMEWPLPMGGGYHYMKFEGKYQDGPNVENFQMHTGPTMANDFSIRYDLPLTLNVVNASHAIELILDLDHWMEAPNEMSIKVMSMIMGNMPMQVKLQKNGANIVKLGSIN